jgi:hypothetical protein
LQALTAPAGHKLVVVIWQQQLQGQQQQVAALGIGQQRMLL